MSSDINYSAVCIDTSILRSSGFDFNGPALGSFKQFKGSAIRVLISDIVHRECLDQLSASIKSSSDKVLSSIQNLNKHSAISSNVLEQLVDVITNNDSALEVAEANLNRFYKDIGAEVIPVDGHNSLGELFDMYFAGKAPFGKGKKKSEFPDAAVLLSIEAWAKEQDSNVILIGSDGDWMEFSEDRRRFIAFEEVDKALEFLQPVNDVEVIKNFLNKERPFSESNFMKEMALEAQEFLNSLNIDPDADSSFHFVSDEESVLFSGMAFIESVDGGVDLSVTRIDATNVDVTMPVEITCNVTACFSSYVADSLGNDYTYMGSKTRTQQIKINADLFLSLVLHVSKGHKSLESIEVFGFQTNRKWIYVDFGHIDPFSEDGY